MHENGAIGAKNAVTAELAPPPAGELVDFRYLAGRDFLSQRDVRMVGKRLVEAERPDVHGAMHACQVGSASADLKIDYVGDGENADFGQLHIEGIPTFGERPRLFRGVPPIGHKRTRGQHADVRVRVVARNELPAKVIEERSEGIGDVDDQGESVQPLPGGDEAMRVAWIGTYHSLL